MDTCIDCGVTVDVTKTYISVCDECMEEYRKEAKWSDVWLNIRLTAFTIVVLAGVFFLIILFFAGLENLCGFRMCTS